VVIEFASNLMNNIKANADSSGDIGNADQMIAEREWLE